MAARRLEIEPQVRWPRRMTPGQAYLIEADLRLQGDLNWPHEEEEFAFTFLLDGGPRITIDALGESTVMLHRFGGTYGPARFVATASDTAGDETLWLSLLTQRGILARTDKLAVTVRGPGKKPEEDRAGISAFTRRVLSTAMRPGARTHYCMIKLQPGHLRQDRYLTTVWSQQAREYPVPLLMDDRPQQLENLPQMLGTVLGPLRSRLHGAEISVEFILPRPLLSHPVDQWIVNQVPLGVEHPVVVRSLERIRSTDTLLHSRWRRNWQRLHASPPSRSVEVARTRDQLLPHLREDATPGCLFLGFRPGSPGQEPRSGAGPAAEVSVLDMALEAGIPAMLWPRRNPGPHFDHLPSMINTGGVGRLPAIVREFRREETARGAQPELSLLWDDPDRIPYEPEMLQAPR